MPEASEAASTLLSSSAGRWLASTSGVACVSTSLGENIWFSRPDCTMRANHSWRRSDICQTYTMPSREDRWKRRQRLAMTRRVLHGENRWASRGQVSLRHRPLPAGRGHGGSLARPPRRELQPPRAVGDSEGAPDPDESLEAAARRETREETGVIVEGPLVDLGHVDYTRSKKRVHGYACAAPQGAIRRARRGKWTRSSSSRSRARGGSSTPIRRRSSIDCCDTSRIWSSPPRPSRSPTTPPRRSRIVR